MGRPLKYNKKEVLEKLCSYLAEGTRPLSRICEEEEGMPVRALIYQWCAQDPSLMDIFMRGQRLWCLAQQDETIKIADDQSRDYQPDGKGGTKSDNSACLRDRLRITTRQWAMARFNPGLFGEKTEVTHAGGIEYKSVVDRPNKETPEQWQERVTKQLQAKAKQVIQ